MTDNDECDCPMCRIMRMAEEVAELRERVAALEESQTIEVAGDVLEDSKVVWRDERTTE